MAAAFAKRRTNTIMAIVATFAVFLPPLSAVAQDSNLKNIERDLERSKADSEDLARKSEEVRIELRLLKGRMINVARKTLDLESELSAIEETIVSLVEEESAKSAALQRQRQKLGRTLGALQRIALLPPEALVAAPGAPVDAVRSATLLRVAVPALEQEAERLKRDLDELEHLRIRIERERAEVSAAGDLLSKERQTLTALIDQKRRLQSRTSDQQAASERKMARLAREAESLRDLLREIECESAEQERLAQEEQERRLALQQAQKEQLEREQAKRAAEARERERLATERATRREGQGELTSRLLTKPPAPKPRESEGQQVASAGTQPPAGSSLSKPANIRAFPSAARNELLMPAHGRLIRRYGQRGQNGSPTSKGITIATREGAQVIAPFDGKVVYAGEFRGYGLILIIEHGKRYHTLLAGVERVDAVVGQWILAGEPIGVMTDDGVRKPELYLELRRNGQAINPLPWLAATGDKVRG